MMLFVEQPLASPGSAKKCFPAPPTPVAPPVVSVDPLSQWASQLDQLQQLHFLALWPGTF